MLNVILISIIIGILRFMVPGHDLSLPGTYEAFAHIWVGVLMVLAWQKNKTALGALILLTVLETVAFLLR